MSSHEEALLRQYSARGIWRANELLLGHSDALDFIRDCEQAGLVILGIDFWLERMNLGEWKRKRTTDLSKGMQQKIQFISTVLHDPDLLILDEPFSGLDPINVEFLIDVMAEFKTQDKTIIFSTHLMETAERLCNDILLINKARKVIGGSLRKVKESYGKNLIALRAEGGGNVLEDKSLVQKVVVYRNGGLHFTY